MLERPVPRARRGARLGPALGKGLPEGAAGALLLAALLGWGVGAHLAGEPYFVNLASRAAILALAAVGLNLALGYGGMVSLGHAAFFGLGGYAAGIAADAAFDLAPIATWPAEIAGTDAMPAIWLGALTLSGLAALGIGAISLRTQGVYFIMITLAFAQMIYYVAIAWPGYGGEDGLPIYLRNRFPGLETTDPIQFFALAFVLLLGALGLTRVLVRARLGRALVASGRNPMRLAALGIAPYPVRLAAFTLSGMIAGLAGALYADLNGFVSPAMLDWHQSGEILVIVILGGTGRLLGPVAGAMLLVFLETWLGGLTQHWKLGLGALLLATVLYARGGLMGLIAGPARDG